jgi:exopolysaccharide biosynthesis polyprenyl glycosylphosphotransferase
MKIRGQHLIILAVYLAIDIACILLAFYIVLLVRPQTVPFPVSTHGFFSTLNPFKFLFLFWTLVILFFHQVYGLYQTNREQLESREIWTVMKSVFVSMLVIIVTAYLLRIQDFPRSVLVLNAVTIAGFCSIWRIFKKLLVNYLVQNGYNNFNVVIVGAGKVGTLLAEEIKKHPSLGINVLGFLDDHKIGVFGSGKWPVLGKIDAFVDVAQKSFVNKIFITTYHNSDVFIRLMEQAKQLGISVRVIPQGYELMGRDPVKYNVGIVPVLGYWDANVNYHLRAKRIFDFAMGWMILLCLLPVFAAIALLIKLDSPGPVFYKSRRYGCRGEIFNMYKFRSMVCEADALLCQLKHKNEMDGPIFKIRNDPRVTRLGAWLRKYSLDELPQILNVIKGDMSLVGPRPLPIDQIEKEDLQQLKRLEVRPGITGLWQVRGRSDLAFVRLVKWDIWYINNWSFGLDLYILLQTIPVVFKGKGAY